jgi:hypothetical protein
MPAMPSLDIRWEISTMTRADDFFRIKTDRRVKESGKDKQKKNTYTVGSHSRPKKVPVYLKLSFLPPAAGYGIS